MKKYFDILELDDSASIEAVERAYKELSNAWRPENYQNLPRYRRKAEAKIKEINEAYERLKFYLATKPHLEAQNNQPAPDPEPVAIEPEPGPERFADRKPDAEAEPALDRPEDQPPWEPELPTQPSEEISRPQIHKTAQKSLVFGFVAILAVLGVLLLYRFFDRQKPPEPQPQTPFVEKAQPTPEAGPQPAATVRPKKSPDPVATAKQSAQKQVPVDKPPAPAAPAPKKIDYQEALTQGILSPYNRNPARIRRIQKSLIANGYDTGPMDGIIGPYTTGALQQFAGDNKMGVEQLFAPDLAGAVVLYAEVAAEHPNWHQIIGSDDFARWLDSQKYYRAEQIQALKNSATARQVNDMIELYKLERNMQPD